MKNLFFVFLFFICSPCFAEGLRVVMMPQGERHAERLMDDLSQFFNEGDLQKFCSCFVKSKIPNVKRVMKDVLFLGINMKIMSINLISEDEKFVKFNVEYTWDNTFQTRTTFSEVTAEFVEKDKLLIKSEKIKNMITKESIHQEPKRNEFLFGGGGQVVFNPRSDDLLPLDIPQVPGGCANGKCGIR